jgi:hypothetical protein
VERGFAWTLADATCSRDATGAGEGASFFAELAGWNRCGPSRVRPRANVGFVVAGAGRGSECSNVCSTSGMTGESAGSDVGSGSVTGAVATLGSVLPAVIGAAGSESVGTTEASGASHIPEC